MFSTTSPLTQPLKWYGGKHYLAQRIIDRMPRHLHYVEPFGGGLAVLLAKDPFDLRLQWGAGRSAPAKARSCCRATRTRCTTTYFEAGTDTTSRSTTKWLAARPNAL